MSARASGKAVVAFTARVDPSVYQRLADAAQERQVSMNFLVEKALVQFLDQLIPANEMQWTRASQ